MQGIGVSVRRRFILRIVRVVAVPFPEADSATPVLMVGCVSGLEMASFIWIAIDNAIGDAGASCIDGTKCLSSFVDYSDVTMNGQPEIPAHKVF